MPRRLDAEVKPFEVSTLSSLIVQFFTVPVQARGCLKGLLALLYRWVQ